MKWYVGRHFSNRELLAAVAKSGIVEASSLLEIASVELTMCAREALHTMKAFILGNGWLSSGAKQGGLQGWRCAAFQYKRD
jgi:hypothetical protein